MKWSDLEDVERAHSFLLTLFVAVLVQFSHVALCCHMFCIPLSACACLCARVNVTCARSHLLDTCSAVPCLAATVLVIVYHFLPIFLCLLFFFSFFPPFPPCFAFFFCFFSFLFSLSIGGVARSCPKCHAPPLWHHGWLCPIRSAAGEGGEWDAGSSESGAGSHHTVLRPWNVSGSTTTTVNRAASLSPFSLPPENYHTTPVPVRSNLEANSALLRQYD